MIKHVEFLYRAYYRLRQCEVEQFSSSVQDEEINIQIEEDKDVEALVTQWQELKGNVIV